MYFHDGFLLCDSQINERHLILFKLEKYSFYLKKLLARVVNASTSECRLWCLGDMWGAIWWLNLPLGRVLGCR